MSKVRESRHEGTQEGFGAGSLYTGCGVCPVVWKLRGRKQRAHLGQLSTLKEKDTQRGWQLVDSRRRLLCETFGETRRGSTLPMGGREREREVKETLLCLVTSSDSIVVTNVKVSKRRQSLGKLDRFVPRHVER